MAVQGHSARNSSKLVGTNWALGDTRQCEAWRQRVMVGSAVLDAAFRHGVSEKPHLSRARKGAGELARTMFLGLKPTAFTLSYTPVLF